MKQPHEHSPSDLEKILGLGVVITTCIFLLELAGGVWTHSLALSSDAWHIFSDIGSLLLSFFAVYLAKRPTSDRRTFGLHRLEVGAAFLNGLIVSVVALGILWAAFQRIHHPREIHLRSLLLIAAAALVLNSVIALLLYPQSRKDINVHGVFLHVLGDALGTVAVILAGGLMIFTHLSWIDSAASALIAGVILWGSVRLLRETVNTFLEGVPRGIHINAVEKEILQVDGVISVHDLHVWSICSHLNALSGHVLLAPSQMEKQHTVLEGINRNLKSRFGISHTTIQLESKAWPEVEQATNW